MQEQQTNPRKTLTPGAVLSAFFWIAVMMALLSIAAPSRSDDSDESGRRAATQAFVGEYVWTGQRESGRLDIFFVQTSENVYAVDFKFRFNGTPHTYSGTAEGSLTEGALEGKVFNEDKRRSWVFKGEFKDGKFSGGHKEIRRTGERRTGTLTFAR